MKLFLQKKCKIFERWGLRPHTPVPPAAGGFAPKPPASGGWGLRPQTPKTAPPIANFWLRAWLPYYIFSRLVLYSTLISPPPSSPNAQLYICP